MPEGDEEEIDVESLRTKGPTAEEVEERLAKTREAIRNLHRESAAAEQRRRTPFTI